MTPKHRAELIEAARSLIAERYEPDRHHVGAALSTGSGRVFCAVHLEAYVGRMAVCAEAIAIGMAAAAGETDLKAIVAVDREGRILSPCGMCRELIADYSPDCLIVMAGDAAVAIGELLPHKYQRH